MENLWNLLFELSSEERMRILLAVKAEKTRLSSLAEKMKFTATEASRQLQRLNEAKLIQRDSEGFFTITKYGELSLSLLDSLIFTSANREYFLEHDTSVLPSEFIGRLSDLRECSFQGDFISTLAYDEEMFRSAEEYAYTIADQIHYSAQPIAVEKIKLGLDLRSILPENLVPPPGLKLTEGVVRRLLPKVDFHLIVTDKEAVFGLPYLNGKMDYSQFVSKDKKFRGWCLDLFNHCWDKTKPLAGQLSNII
jgi:predicted transcriptional regulator